MISKYRNALDIKEFFGPSYRPLTKKERESFESKIDPLIEWFRDMPETFWQDDKRIINKETKELLSFIKEIRKDLFDKVKNGELNIDEYVAGSVYLSKKEENLKEIDIRSRPN